MNTCLRYVCLLTSATAFSVINGATLEKTSSTFCTAPSVTSSSTTGCFAHGNGISSSADVVSEAMQFGFLDLTTMAFTDGPTWMSEAQGSIRFADQFLVDAGPGSGFVELTATWEGDAMDSLPSFLRIAGITSFLTPGAEGQFSILAPIAFGQTYGISGEVNLRSEAGRCFGCGRADLKSLELRVLSIRVLNASGTELSDFKFRTDSTVEYGFTGGQFDPGAGVPEPASLLMLGSGLVGLGMFRRRSRTS